LNPAWTATFQADYSFGKETKFNVGVFDEVRKTGKPLSMGSALFEIGECLAARGNIKAKKLKNGGTLFVRVTVAAHVEHGSLNLALRGIKLKNVDGMFSKSDPFFVVNAQVNAAGGRTWLPVYRSETIQNDLNPTWKPFSIPMDKLCEGEKNKPIMVEVFDWEKSGKHQVMGRFETNVNGLISSKIMDNGAKPKDVPLTSAMMLKHKNKAFGSIVVTQANITGEDLTPQQPASAYATAMATPSEESKMPDFGLALDADVPSRAGSSAAPAVAAVAASASSFPPAMAPPPTFTPGSKPKFVDYLSGGCEISLGVAIDFTGSNGDPRKPGTLHYIHPDDTLNDYEKAVTAVGSIVARYDSDQKFPVWGFGAKYGGQVQHCFQVGRETELSGVRGILEGYRATFKTGLTMSGPTVFAEVIDFAASQARSRQEANQRIGKQSYTVLLILTDGAVTDIEQTKQSIRYASSAPLSIVIIGIG
jgi:hypothetical protein